TWYSVISPESCSSILWRSWDFKEKAADALKLTANDMLENKLIDGIIKEPAGGAHTNPEKMFQILKTEIKKHLDELVEKDVEIRINNRIEKFGNMGVFVEEGVN
ncbi:MAG: acetyl-CoA carboxylase carboxyl transferase subunit alpha, partial [Bacteroidia bacterium]|nr:acetyl-CoA carboxylase carboxyl transferase subunit alpha [Bacteroidia bacterium]